MSTGITLLGVLVKHASHDLQSETSYEIPPGRVYGTPHVILHCKTCDLVIWNEALGSRSKKGKS